LLPLDSTTDIEECVRKESNQKQPFLLFISDDSNEVAQSFIIADFKVVMANKDLVQAIDTTFKIVLEY